MMGIVVPDICWASNKICNKYNLLNLVGILFPHTYYNDELSCDAIKSSIFLTVFIKFMNIISRQITLPCKFLIFFLLEYVQIWRLQNYDEATIVPFNVEFQNYVR
jgi:hypothetical protein